MQVYLLRTDFIFGYRAISPKRDAAYAESSLHGVRFHNPNINQIVQVYLLRADFIFGYRAISPKRDATPLHPAQN